MSDKNAPDPGRFPVLHSVWEQLPPDVRPRLLHDYIRMHDLLQEIESKRKSARMVSENMRVERELLRTALLGVLRLSADTPRDAFLVQMLEIISRLAGAELGALALWTDPSAPPQLVTRHCTPEDRRFVEGELLRENGLLRLARDRGEMVHLPNETSGLRMIEDLRQRHVSAGVAVPFAANVIEGQCGLLYLEHLSRKDAFQGELVLVQECLSLVTARETWEAQEAAKARRLDYTVPLRSNQDYRLLRGRSRPFAKALSVVELFRASGSEASVLLSGESGVGRTRLAQALHEVSPRSGEIFHVVRCEQAGDDLKRTIFGSTSGAGHRSEPGLLARAARGTVFFSNVALLEPSIQQRLVRVLREQRILSEGGTLPEPCEVRLLASIQGTVAEALSGGRLVGDLAERCGLFHIHLPPLRERRQDILPLAEGFLRDFARETGEARAQLTGRAIEVLERRSWPGNVSELRDCLKAAVEESLDHRLGAALFEEHGEPLVEPVSRGKLGTWKEELTRFQRRLIKLAMARNGSRVASAADALGITRQYLNNRLRILGLSELRE